MNGERIGRKHCSLAVCDDTGATRAIQEASVGRDRAQVRRSALPVKRMYRKLVEQDAHSIVN